MHIQLDITPNNKNPSPTQQSFMLNKSWVLSYLRHRNSQPQKLLGEWVQALGATISGIFLGEHKLGFYWSMVSTATINQS